VVPKKKPAPDIYEWVLRNLDLPAAACLVIEDSPIGLAAALAAHLPTVVTTSAYTTQDQFPGALAVLSSLGEPDHPASQLSGVPLSGPCVTASQLIEWHACQTMLASVQPT
jgi:beta-phosphoglucomutase-like phosphatase (HAD superfamily)